MEVQTIINEIRQLPLSKRFLVMEQTLKSIKEEESGHISWSDDNLIYVASETSLAKEWLSEEDNRWDNLL